MNDQYSYETGSTQPPKSHRGLVAVLLAAVILLCGITTALGLLNIRLRLELKNTQDQLCGAQFQYVSEPVESLSATDKSSSPALGIRGQELTELAQRFYRLPPGFWVQSVLPGGPAAQAGLLQGDIIRSIAGTPVTTADSIRTVLSDFKAGDSVQLQIYRGTRQLLFTVTLA